MRMKEYRNRWEWKSTDIDENERVQMKRWDWKSTDEKMRLKEYRFKDANERRTSRWKMMKGADLDQQDKNVGEGGRGGGGWDRETVQSQHTRRVTRPPPGVGISTRPSSVSRLVRGCTQTQAYTGHVIVINICCNLDPEL